MSGSDADAPSAQRHPSRDADLLTPDSINSDPPLATGSYIDHFGNRVTRVEVPAESVERWVGHVREMSEKALMGQTKSWFTGHNTNIDRDDNPRLMVYTGGSRRFRRWIAAEADRDYSGFRFSR